MSPRTSVNHCICVIYALLLCGIGLFEAVEEVAESGGMKMRDVERLGVLATA
jgi:hypothetical protein